jgi:hypothetical protein
MEQKCMHERTDQLYNVMDSMKAMKVERGKNAQNHKEISSM